MGNKSRGGVSRRRPSGWLRLCLLLSVLFLLLPGWPLRSQQPPTISVNVKVVNVLATVRNKQGEIVRNLTKDDFMLEEDDRPQSIGYFARETDLPLTLGLLVDTSMSQRRVLDQERSASSTFLDQVLRVNKDMAFVIHFDREVELLQDLTSSRQKLESALGLLQTPQPTQEGGSNSPGSGPGSRRRAGGGGGGTLLYDAVYLASNELMKKQQGRKALIILSDGVDRGSKETLASAVEAAQRADTLVYSILFADEQGYGSGGGFGGRGMGGMGGMGRHGGGRGRYPQETRPDGKKILERISKETGARLFEVSKKQPIEQIYDRIQEELRNQYSLGYTPDRADAGAGYHKIRLVAKQKDLTVQARDGYYAER
ncbi:MAG: VWA domain-containing protein [Terriglobia bacterium]